MVSTINQELTAFFRWFMGIAAVAIVIYGVAWLASGQWGILGFAIIALIAALIGWVGQALVRQQREMTAIWVFFLGIFVLQAVAIIILPDLMIVWAFAPLMPLALAIGYAPPNKLLPMIIATIIGSLVAIIFTGAITVFPPLPALYRQILAPTTVGLILAVSTFIFWQANRRLSQSLLAVEVSNLALHEAQTTLASQVAERTQALQLALDAAATQTGEQAKLLAENARQRAAILELSVPVLPVSHQTLVVPLVGDLDATRIEQARDRILGSLDRRRARTVLLDVTGVPVIDSQVALGLISIADAARLLGAEAILIGVRPEVAQTIVSLGLDLQQLRSFADLQSALATQR